MGKKVPSKIFNVLFRNSLFVLFRNTFHFWRNFLQKPYNWLHQKVRGHFFAFLCFWIYFLAGTHFLAQFLAKTYLKSWCLCLILPLFRNNTISLFRINTMRMYYFGTSLSKNVLFRNTLFRINTMAMYYFGTLNVLFRNALTKKCIISEQDPPFFCIESERKENIIEVRCTNEQEE